MGRESRPDKGDENTDWAYEQNKTWAAIVLQLGYLICMCVCIPYMYVASPVRHEPAWLGMRVFLPLTMASSAAALAAYFLYGHSDALALTLVAYGTVCPYVSWGCSAQYLATAAEMWNWLTLSMVLTILLVSPRWATGLVALQVLTPLAGGLLDAFDFHNLDLNMLLIRAFNTIVPTCATWLALLFFTGLLNHTRRQSALQHELGLSILRNILPMPVAIQLMEGLALSSKVRIAHNYSTATVCFCDIVGFTKLCLTVSPIALVDTLNDIFSYFDRLCLLHGVEKVKTIGDAYMCVGLPTSDESHAEAAMAVIHVAVEMVQHMANFSIRETRLQIRVGAHSGPVVAGVIGCTKFAYDIWGPTVNLASRLESSGIPGEVQVSAATRDLVAPRFPCNYRATLELKGAGVHDVFLVDRTQIPNEGESPQDLEALGLDDMAYLVQEINRRQSMYTFSAGKVMPDPNALSVASLRSTPAAIIRRPSYGAGLQSPVGETAATRRRGRLMSLIRATSDYPAESVSERRGLSSPGWHRPDRRSSLVQGNASLDPAIDVVSDRAVAEEEAVSPLMASGVRMSLPALAESRSQVTLAIPVAMTTEGRGASSPSHVPENNFAHPDFGDQRALPAPKVVVEAGPWASPTVDVPTDSPTSIGFGPGPTVGQGLQDILPLPIPSISPTHVPPPSSHPSPPRDESPAFSFKGVFGGFSESSPRLPVAGGTSELTASRSLNHLSLKPSDRPRSMAASPLLPPVRTPPPALQAILARRPRSPSPTIPPGRPPVQILESPGRHSRRLSGGDGGERQYPEEDPAVGFTPVGPTPRLRSASTASSVDDWRAKLLPPFMRNSFSNPMMALGPPV